MAVKQNPYDHAEAYCIMSYRCNACQSVEKLWNSRDGVTPFIIGCAQDGCDGEAQHIHWASDKRAVDHIPEIGDRIFIDLSEEQALEIAKRRIEGTDFPIPEQYDSAEEFATELADSIYNGGIEPDIAVVDQELQKQFLGV